MGAGFGVATGIALLLFMEDIPVVRRDIFLNIPIIGKYWEKTVPPEDNPF
jgi:ubiquinol-cytochrome-c reductase complex QCR10 subunit